MTGLVGYPDEAAHEKFFRQTLDELFDLADADGSGDLCLAEAISFGISVTAQMSSRVQADEGKAVAKTTLSLAVGVLVLGWLVFSFLEEEWTLTDSLYFCVITLTTVGLGDFAPTTAASTLFWYVYIVLGLGLLAAAGGGAMEFMAEKAAMMQRRVDLAGGSKMPALGPSHNTPGGRTEVPPGSSSSAKIAPAPATV